MASRFIGSKFEICIIKLEPSKAKKIFYSYYSIYVQISINFNCKYIYL